MFEKVKVLAAAAIIALAVPMAASARTTLVDDGSYILDAPGAAPFLGNIDAVGGAGDFSVTFTATPPNYGSMQLSIISEFLDLFKDLKVEWQTTGGSVLKALDPLTVGTSTLVTTFDVANATQKLVFSWTQSDDSTEGGEFEPLGFDFRVRPVPVPAAGFLLLGALGGLGLARRRKKAS